MRDRQSGGVHFSLRTMAIDRCQLMQTNSEIQVAENRFTYTKKNGQHTY